MSPASGFVLCVDNSDYPGSLVRGKAYEVVPDEDLAPEYIRIIDESEEDYIYPRSRFFTKEDL